MKVLCYFPAMPPSVIGGAESYQERFVIEMLSWGWEVKVCTLKPANNKLFENLGYRDMHVLTKQDWPDICISTHYYFRHLKTSKPVYVIQHSLNFQPFPALQYVRMIYCAEHVMHSHHRYMAARRHSLPTSFVLRPPIRFKPVKKPKKAFTGYITSINLALEKGGNDFKLVCSLMPDMQFMGIKGGWGAQRTHPFPNVIYIEPNNEMLKHYANVGILLMLSKNEGLPTVILEALSQAIPVVAYDIPGAREALGDVGYYARNAHDVAEQIKAVIADYPNASRRALARYRAMEPDWNALKDYLCM